MMDITRASFAALFGLLICVVPVVFGAWFAFRPSERLLAQIRPVSLAGLFAALCSLALTFINGFHAVASMKALDLNSVRFLGVIMTEGLAPVVVSFALLTVSWALVAIGMRRG